MGRKRSEVVPPVIASALSLETPQPGVDYDNNPGRGNAPGYPETKPAVPTARELVESQIAAVDELFNDPSVAHPAPLETGFQDEGQVVEVTWGKEYFQPVQFHGVDVGPFTGRTIVRSGETLGTAVLRLYEELDEVARVIRTKKQNSYVDSMVRLRDEVARR